MALRKLKFLWAFLFTYPGAPTVYYGDEAGLATSGVWDGSRWQADPYCRAAYPWHDLGFSPNEDLRQSVRILAGWRQTYPALRQGTYRTISTDDKQHLFSFRRDSDNQTVYVALNRDSQPHDLTLPVDSGTGSLTELFSGTTVTASNGKLAIHQMGGLTAQVFVAGKK
jgi:alpha-glucosidase